jgi:hypothetical protein
MVSGKKSGWRVDTWDTMGHTVVQITHCARTINYNIKYHDIDKILTCKSCGEMMPEDKMTQMLKITRVIKKYDLDY